MLFFGGNGHCGLRGYRAILPQPLAPALARGESTREINGQVFRAEVNARARQIATAAENAAGAKKKYTPQRIVNPR